MRPVLRMLSVLTSAFPLWVLVASGLALLRPTLFTWFSGPLITIGLGVIMLSMGMTLGFEDFRRVGRERRRVLPLTALLAGSRIEVSATGLFLDTVQVVILPVMGGALLKWRFPRLIEPILPVAPLVAVVTITLIVASVIGAERDQLVEAGPRLLLAVFCLHAFGFLVGYAAGKGLLDHEIAARTVAIEVGMQNSGLGVVLARGNFANPAVAVPSAISTVFHSLIGSLVAAWWRRATPE